MILGLGIDVCSIERVEAMLQRWGERFARRILSARERRAIARRVDRAAAVAGRFAAKEAFAKALARQSGRGVGWHEVEIEGGGRAPPRLRVSGEARARVERMGGEQLHLSIAHDGGVAVAVVVIEGEARGASGSGARPRPR
ncbi:MAG: holo-ACP synthase [Deltaproteobacteria bacterium]|nr:holo-ACP synthase [Deltaproteobacteria bacterium]